MNETKNPFKPHALSVFADRDSIDEALTYAMDVINRMDDNKPQALTALMVVVNTAAKLWPQAPAQAADLSTLDALRSRIAALEEWRDGPSPIPTHFIQLVDERIESWAEENFNETTIAENLDEDQLATIARNLDKHELVRAIDFSEVLDYSEIAEAVDLSNLAEEFDTSNLAEEINLSNLAEELDLETVARKVDLEQNLRDFFQNNTFSIRP